MRRPEHNFLLTSSSLELVATTPRRLEEHPMPTDFDLDGLRVAVTGGTSGLGLALVQRLTSRGARVAFVARTAPAVARTARTTGAHGIVGDVGCKQDIHPIALQV